MQKSLFTKYFSVCAVVILLSITIFGMMVLLFSTQYFKDDKINLLEENARTASDLAMENYESNARMGSAVIDRQVLMYYFKTIARAIGADVYMVERATGVTLVCSHNAPCNHTAYLVPEPILLQAETEGVFRELGRLGGIYMEEYYTVGVPLRLQGQTNAVIFASSSAATFQTLLHQLLKIFLLSAVVVMLFTSVVIYFVTKRLVRPLQEMLAATQSFAKGDFTVRVPVERYDEIGKLAMAFNNMATALSSQETLRRSFIANVSHELKTPMTTIAGFIDGILDGTIPVEKRDKYLGIVSDEVKRLSRVVRSMLNIARIEAGEMKLVRSDFDVTDIVCRTVFNFEQPIELKHLEVRGLDAGKIPVNADVDLVHQVVYNLIENAVKFADEGGYISASFSTEGGMVYVGIRNSGGGLSKEEIPRVFDRFYKTDRSRSMDKYGVGLGLHIVRSIVNLHGGEIIVKSVQGEYCEFQFSLPVSQKSSQSIFRKTEKNKQSLKE